MRASGRRCGSSPSTRTCGTSSGPRRRWPARTRSCAPIARTSGAIRTRSSGRSAARSRSARRRPRPNASGRPCWSTTGRRSSRVEGDVSFWTGTPEQIAETILSYRRVGFHTFIVELPAPYDVETIETLDQRRQADGRGVADPGLTVSRPWASRGPATIHRRTPASLWRPHRDATSSPRQVSCPLPRPGGSNPAHVSVHESVAVRATVREQSTASLSPAREPPSSRRSGSRRCRSPRSRSGLDRPARGTPAGRGIRRRRPASPSR